MGELRIGLSGADEVQLPVTSTSPPVALFVGADAKYMMDFRGPLISAYRDRGWRPIVLATPVPGFHDGRVADVGGEFIPWNLSKAGLNPFADLDELKVLWRTIKDLQPDVVFSHTIKTVIYSMVLARLAGVPRRASMIPGLGYAFTPGRGVRRRAIAVIARAAYSVAFRSADIVILQNRDDQEFLTRLGILSRATRSAVVNGSGVDLDRFRAMELPTNPITFLMVARLIRDKGVYEFVEAARQVKKAVPGARFILVGDTDSNPASVLPAEIAAWRNEGIVEIRGYMPDPRSAFAESHVFVLPSYYREGIPRTNLEALATARAIITTDTPGCRETVENNVNGILVPPRDARALAEAMLTLASDRKQLEEMAAASRRLCEARFELGQVTRATLAHIQGVDKLQA